MLHTCRGRWSDEHLSGYVLRPEDRPDDPVVIVYLGHHGELHMRPAECHALVSLVKDLVDEAELGAGLTRPGSRSLSTSTSERTTDGT